MKQTAKIFSMMPSRAGQTSIDRQINDYLELHPDYRIINVSYAAIGNLEKALVIFNVEKPREEIKNDRPERTEKKEFKQNNFKSKGDSK